MRRLSDRSAMTEARRFKTLTLGRAVGGGAGGVALPQPTAQNQMIIADVARTWTLLAAPTAQYQVLVTGADPYTQAWVARFDATVPNVIEPDDAAATGSAFVAAHRDHEHGIVCAAPASPSVSLAASAEGSGTSFARDDHAHQLNQAIAPTWTSLHTFNLGIMFGGASGANIITVPDNAAQAMHVVDAGGLEYLRVVSTDAQPAFVFNAGTVDADFRVAASGVPYALFVRGSDHYIGASVENPLAPFHVHGRVLLNTGVAFSGTVPTPYIETPDNAAIALRLMDAGTLEYLRIISTDAQPVVVFNEGGADVDHRWEASGQANALFIEGSTGNIGAKTSAPAADWQIVASTVANKHYSLYRTQILEDDNVVLQLIGDDESTSMAHIVLTGAPASGDNKHWIISHLGPVVGNRFSIGYNTSGADDFSIYDVARQYFVILNDGDTGSGTSAPISAFDITRSNVIPALSIVCYDDGDAEARLYLRKSDTDTIGTLAQTDDGDWLGLIGFQGVTTGNAWGYGTYIKAIQRGVAGATYIETDLILQTYSSVAANVDQLVLDGGTGFIGMYGVAAPLAPLHIDQASGTGAVPVLILDQADISEGFINFIGSNRGIITGTTNSDRSVRVELAGVVYRLALYADA